MMSIIIRNWLILQKKNAHAYHLTHLSCNDSFEGIVLSCCSQLNGIKFF